MTTLKKYIINISLIAALAFFGLASFLPITSMWGFNHLKYFPGYVYIIYAVIALLIIAPFIGNKLLSLLTKFSDYFQRLNKPLRIIIISIIAGGLFYLLRVHVHSIGDGYQRIFEIEKGILYYYTEPLDFFLHAVLYRLLLSFGIQSAELSYVIISIVSGIIFVNSIYLFKFPDEINSTTAVFIKFLILASGGIQVYFGYVESYSLYYLFGILFFLWAIKFLTSGRGIIAASVMLSLAIASHLTALFLLPANIYLIYYNFKVGHPGVFLKKYLPIIIVGLVWAVLSFLELRLRIIEDTLKASYTSLILPVFSSTEYSILSPQHFYDIFNEILLISPYCLLVGAAFFRFKKGGTDNRHLRLFLFIQIVFALAVMFTIDPLLGYARDWDLFATPAVIFGLSLSFLLLIGYNKSISKYEAFVIGSISILFLSGWILLNSSEKRQLERANDLILLSDKGHQYCTELLAYYYRHEKNDNLKTIELYKSIKNYENNSRLNKKLGDAQKDLGLIQDAELSYRRALNKEPMNPALLNKFGQILMTQGMLDSAVIIFYKARRLAPDTTSIIESLALAYIYKNEYNQALSWADTLESKDIHSPGASLIRLTIAARQNDWPTARKHYLEFIEYGKSRSDYEKMGDFYKNLK